jgi:sporulation protein YlmC with PRC-barrel domain
MDEGLPEAWEALTPGVPVYSSDGERVGEVKEVLAVPEDDIFEGLIVKTPHGDRFADWEVIGSIHERGVDLKMDSTSAGNLPEPKAAPAAMGVGVDEVSESRGAYKREIWWKRFWNRISGNY